MKEWQAKGTKISRVAYGDGMEIIMKLNSDFVTHQSGDEQLMISVGGSFNGIVRSNSTAAKIIELLGEETTEEKIVDALLEIYDVDREKASKDVGRIISDLRKIGAIDE
jgi:dissimilatory sulfite reductase (desulfoviridin) alpha/beta subunit